MWRNTSLIILFLQLNISPLSLLCCIHYNNYKGQNLAGKETTMEKITEAGGTIVKPIFSFPGGRRFQFTEPSGNEFAVWSDQGME